MEVRCEPATRSLQSEPHRFHRQRFDMAGHGVVALVAMDVDAQAAPGGDFTQPPQ